MTKRVLVVDDEPDLRRLLRWLLEIDERCSGIAESRGHPKKVGSTKASQDEAVARRLWDLSEELTDVRYDALAR